jgi:archaellum component FlaC
MGKITINDLGAMIIKEFEKTNNEIGEVKKEVTEIRGELKGLKQGQDDIEMRLTNVAYRFELNELQQRVKMLEEKVG